MSKNQTDQFDLEKIINDLEDAFNKLKNGKLSYQIHNSFDDERIHSLLNSFNNMAEIFNQKEQHYKEIYQKLIINEKRYRTFVTHSSEGIYRVDIIPPVPINLSSTKIIDWINENAVVGEVNVSLAAMYGLQPKDMIGRPVIEFAPDYGKRAELILHNENCQVSNEETMDIDKDGVPIFLLESYHGDIEDDKLCYIWGVQHNITEIKKTRDALQKSEMRFRLLTENARDVIYRISIPDGKYDFISSASLEIFGYSPEEFYSNPLLLKKIIHPGWIGYFEKQWKSLLDGIMPPTYEYQIIHKSGEIRWINQRNFLVKDTDKKPIALESIASDITERKKTEEELKEIKALLEAVFEQSPIPMVMASAPDGILEIINPATRKILGIERENKYLGRSLYDIKPSWQDLLPDGTPLSLPELPLTKALQGIETRNMEMKVIRRDGSVRWEIVDGVPIYSIKNELIGGFIIFPDITERRLAEKQIQKDLKEKEIMLKEINHRVKNNLNVITSLLNLQSAKIKNKEQALTAFKESRDRILTMALVHEKLYQTGDFSSIDMKSYLNDISSQLLNAYISDKKIRVDVEIKDVIFDINIAIPCGLIINELVTNAIKHAFPGNAEGEIEVCLKKRTGKNFYLSVSDNGIGVPDQIMGKNYNSLGLELVSLLVAQINGSMQVKRNRGSIFVITFPGN